jgi:hypothetical protein
MPSPTPPPVSAPNTRPLTPSASKLPTSPLPSPRASPNSLPPFPSTPFFPAFCISKPKIASLPAAPPSRPTPVTLILRTLPAIEHELHPEDEIVTISLGNLPRPIYGPRDHPTRHVSQTPLGAPPALTSPIPGSPHDCPKRPQGEHRHAPGQRLARRSEHCPRVLRVGGRSCILAANPKGPAPIPGNSSVEEKL